VLSARAYYMSHTIEELKKSIMADKRKNTCNGVRIEIPCLFSDMKKIWNP
jgi:hypothetical protein